jgi:hypothetical protein
MQVAQETFKAADNLLKLGMSLGNVDRKKEACLTFSQLAREFPHSSQDIKESAKQEEQSPSLLTLTRMAEAIISLMRADAARGSPIASGRAWA